MMMAVHGHVLPFRRYVFRTQGQKVHVYYFVWDDLIKENTLVTGIGLAGVDRLRSVFLGKGNSGQRILELAIQGTEDARVADSAVREKLAALVCFESPTI